MRSKEEYEKVIELHKKGINNVQISKITNIPRPTVVGWVNGKINVSKNKKNVEFDPEKYIKDNNLEKEYSYILGLYLGDGYISKQSRTFKMRICLDIKYDNLNLFAIQKLSTLFPNNKPHVLKLKNKITNLFNQIILSIHNNNLNLLFPQYGVGKKHLREIKLTKWQTDIIDYKYLLLGFFHSDGCYYYNKTSKSFSYSFTNFSTDIINIYKQCCEKNNLSFFVTKANAKNGIKYQVVVGRKKDVEIFNNIFGTKMEIPNNFLSS